MKRPAPLVLLLLLSGCPKADVTQAECRLTSDCPTPLLCNEGRCVPECRDDVDCPTGQECVADRCSPRTPPARVCAFGRDCLSGETCRAGLCAAVALVDPGVDSPSGDAGSDAGTPPPPSDGGVPGGNPDASGPPPTGLPYGSVCSDTSQCATMLCLGDGSQGRCTRTCARNSDCVLPDVCLDVSGQLLCGTTPSVGGTGAACPNGPSDCASGLCLSPEGAAPICTHQCLPLPTCPAGLTCQPVADGAGGALSVCIPGSGAGFGESCGRAADCASNLCVGVANSGQGVCTAFCDQVPCPAGHTCAEVQSPTAGTTQVCAPEGSVGGDFGAACTGASSCSNGLCLNDARTGRSFCTIPCASNAQCTAVPGLLCVTIQGGGQVCGPA